MPVGPCDVVLEVNLLRQVHLGRDGREDEALLAAVGQRELDLAVQSAGTKEGGIESVLTVGGHDHLRENILNLARNSSKTNTK